MRPAFVFAPDKCTGCEACRVACGNENGAGRDTGWRQVTTLNPTRHPALPTRHLSLACNHCDTPACLRACPTAAYRRDAATGAVLIDPDRCIGCRYCSWVCPYDAPRYDAQAGVMTKCTFCSSRLAAGGQPACTQACPTGALALGEHGPEDLEATGPGLAPTGLGPALRLLQVRPARVVETTLPRATSQGPPPQPLPPRKMGFGREWPLALLTTLLPALVAWFGAGLLRPERAPSTAELLVPGGLALLVSTLHLGRPRRAWRAVVNLGTSWLSREALLAPAFLVLAGLNLAWPSPPRLLPPFALCVGIGLCVAIDGVYWTVARLEPRRAHGAEAVPTVAFLLGVMAGLPWLTIPLAAFKAASFVGRWERGRHVLPPRGGSVRLLALVGAVAPGLHWPTTAALAVIGEALDRVAFYENLEPSSPARRMAEDAQRLSAA
jgi:Fe-S-cluster-containing dehydrogenase component